MGTNLFICSIICMVLLNLVDTQNLVAIRSSVNLPTGRYFVASSYDGNDIISIVGGYDSAYVKEIVEYKISTDSIRVIPTASEQTSGSVAADGNGNLYYTGGKNRDTVFKTNQDHTDWTEFVELPKLKSIHGLVQPTAQTALLIGGQYDSDDITLLDMSSATATNFATIPEMAGKDYATAVLDGKGNVIIFSCSFNSKTTVIKYVLATKQYTVLSTTFPSLITPTSVRDGNFVYLTGAQERANYGGILQFDLTTSQWKNLPVTNHPVPRDIFQGTSAIFVPQLNRVYYFGGYGEHVSPKYLDEIWWIQLSQATTTEPTTTTDAASDLPTTVSSTTVVPCRDYENSVGIESVGFNNFLDAAFQSYGTWLINNGLDPSAVNPTSMTQTINSAFLSLSAVYSDTAGSGMSNALRILNIQSDFTLLEFSVTVELHNISIYGLYSANGIIISLYPIEGKGKYEIRYTNLEVNLKISGFGITEGFVNLGIYDSKETVFKYLDGRVVLMPDLVKPEDADGLGADVLIVLGDSIETMLTEEEKHPVVRSVWGYLDFMFAKTPLTEIIATTPAPCL